MGDVADRVLTPLEAPTDYIETLLEVGSGAYGKVYKASLKKVKRLVAVKVLPIIPEEREEIALELDVLAKFSTHRNIARFHAAYLDRDFTPDGHGELRQHLWLAMQYCAYGSATTLTSKIRRPKPSKYHPEPRKPAYMPENTIAYIISETAAGLEYLHANKIIHRDIKGQNILFTRNLHVKLVDFGVCALLSEHVSKRDTVIGTPYWMAPEVVLCQRDERSNTRYDARCDVWSLGITAIEIAEGYPPHHKVPALKLLHRIPDQKAPTLGPGHKWSKAFHEFIGKSLQKNPKKRPRSVELSSIRWLSADVAKAKENLQELVTSYLPPLPLDDPEEWFQEVEDHDDVVETLVLSRDGKLPITKQEQYGKQHEGTNNLAKLKSLTESKLVALLSDRFRDNVIYTNIADILIACNPYQRLPIYTDGFHETFSPAHQGPRNPFPHIFAAANSAFNQLRDSGVNQCCVISGESGAGKTETAKLFLRHLLYLTSHHSTAVTDVTKTNVIERQIIGCNPVLEAFGNAKTTMNDNSSRFGKFLTVSITPHFQVEGVTVAQYLLEKSRVVKQAVNEQNFHIFYYLVLGWDEKRPRATMMLSQLEDYTYLGGCSPELEDLDTLAEEQEPSDPKSRRKSRHDRDLEKRLERKHVQQAKRRRREHPDDDYQQKFVERRDEARDGYNEVTEAMKAITFTAEEIVEINLILSLILHLGNVEFAQDPSSDYAIVITPEALDTVSQFLGMAVEQVKVALTSMITITRGETISRPYRPHQAADTRDSTAKAVYARLFAWIVTRINNVLSVTEDANNFEIGILDIFGFEHFEVNSLEQLCINIANEQLQYYFNQHVFAWEMEELKAEGVRVDQISYLNNKHILDMFLADGGLLALIDEESYFPKANDASLMDKVTANLKKDKALEPHKSRHTLSFAVNHYASKVSYSYEGMIEKNRDNLSSMIEDLLKDCGLPLIRMLFRHEVGATGILGSDWQDDLDDRHTAAVLKTLTPEKFRNFTRRVSASSQHPDMDGQGNGSASDSTRRRTSAQDFDASDVQILRERGKSRKHRRKSRRSLYHHTPKQRKKQTICSHFRNSLRDLMAKMMAATPHFVRCLKTNASQKADSFDIALVKDQLRYTGVMATIQIRKVGFPARFEFDEFFRRYQIVAFEATHDIGPTEAEAACAKILNAPMLQRAMDHLVAEYGYKQARGSLWELGNTKIFLKDVVVDALSEILRIHDRSAVVIQSVVRRFLARHLLERLKREKAEAERRKREEEERRKREEEERKRRELAEKQQREHQERLRKQREAEEQRKREEAERLRRQKQEEARRSVARAKRKSAAAVTKRHIEMSVAPYDTADYKTIPLNLVKKNRIPPGTDHLNRYMNILPNPRTRVRLQEVDGDPRTAYINANYIHGWDGAPQAYIATQGPVPHTINDFWRLVWESNTKAVVMVTGIRERGVVKCARYWPTVLYNETEQIGDKQYGDINVAVMSGFKANGYLTSKLRVIRDGEERTVMHYWFNSWPDHGVPHKTDPVVHMLDSVREWSNDEESPWIVHCSAGVGRTGTFLACDMGMQQLRHTGRTDVCEIIRALRKDRCAMVQHPEQAEFSHRVLVEFADAQGAPPEPLVTDEDNEVLLNSIARADNCVPPGFDTHPSQKDGDEADETTVPTWRLETLRRRDEELREEILELEMQDEVGRRRAQILRERQRAKEQARSLAMERLHLLESGAHEDLIAELGVKAGKGVRATLKKKQEEIQFLFDEDSDEEPNVPLFDFNGKGSSTQLDVDGASEAMDGEDYLALLEKQATAFVGSQPTTDYERNLKRASVTHLGASDAPPVVANLPRQDQDDWKTKPPLTWKPRNVVDWTRSLPAIEHLSTNMSTVQGAELMDITDVKLKRLGISDPKDRKVLRQQLKQLKLSTKNGIEAMYRRLPRRTSATLDPSHDRYIAVASYPGNAAKNQPAFSEGDVMVLLQEVSDDWLEMRLMSGKTGLVPANYVRHHQHDVAPAQPEERARAASHSSSQQHVPRQAADTQQVLVAIADFAGEQGQVTVLVGDHVVLESKLSKDWYKVETPKGAVGLAPVSFFKKVPSNPKFVALEDYYADKGALVLTKGEVFSVSRFVVAGYELVVPGGNTHVVPRRVAVPFDPDYRNGLEMEAIANFKGGAGKLSLTVAETVQAISKLTDDWLIVRKHNSGAVGYVPASFLRDMSKATETMVAVSSYDAKGKPGHVSIRAEQEVVLLKHLNEDWSMVATNSGARGLVPRGYLQEATKQNTTEIMRVKEEYRVPNNPLSLYEGEPVTLLERLGSQWGHVRRANGETGSCPLSFLRHATVLYRAFADYDGYGTQLSCSRGETFVLLAFKSNEWIQARSKSGMVGLLPSSYVQEVTPDEMQRYGEDVIPATSRVEIIKSEVPVSERKQAFLQPPASDPGPAPRVDHSKEMPRTASVFERKAKLETSQSPRAWSVDQVVAWLHKQPRPFCDFGSMFRRYQIDGAELEKLSKNDLADMGMDSAQLRSELIDLIKPLFGFGRKQTSVHEISLTRKQRVDEALKISMLSPAEATKAIKARQKEQRKEEKQRAKEEKLRQKQLEREKKLLEKQRRKSKSKGPSEAADSPDLSLRRRAASQGITAQSAVSSPKGKRKSKDKALQMALKSREEAEKQAALRAVQVTAVSSSDDDSDAISDYESESDPDGYAAPRAKATAGSQYFRHKTRS
eukprot:m.358959 g.358959  ORF g.358959 m.358959 type:complete len:2697 (+) comp18357_c0_seq1:279-8369(+)